MLEQILPQQQPLCNLMNSLNLNSDRKGSHLDLYPKQKFNHSEFADILFSVQNSINKMQDEKRHVRRNSKESNDTVSLDIEDCDKEKDKEFVDPNILTLLDDLDACITKLKGPSGNDECSENDQPLDHTDSNKPTNLNRLSEATLIDDKGFFISTFSRRSSKLITPRERQGSLASIASFSTLASTTPSSPRTHSFNQANPHSLSINDSLLAATHKGYLSKHYPASFFTRKQWKRRQYFLVGSLLLRLKTNSDVTHGTDIINLTAATTVCVTDDFAPRNFVLKIQNPTLNGTTYLSAESSEELSQWLTAIKDAITRARFEHEMLPPSPEFSPTNLVETRRSSTQTLPSNFQRSSDILPQRLARANSQPLVQTYPLNKVPSSSSIGPTSQPTTPAQTISPTHPPIRLAAHRLRHPNRGSVINAARRPSLAPLQESVLDEKEFGTGTDHEFFNEVFAQFKSPDRNILDLFPVPGATSNPTPINQSNV